VPWTYLAAVGLAACGAVAAATAVVIGQTNRPPIATLREG
jgi:hypothetical protein